MHGTEPISAGRVQDIVEIANARQLDVDQAEKDFEDISSVLYCEKHIGETMSGRITKIRTASIEEGYEDDIVVIVKNEERGINVEIPLSQILGRQAHDCSLSEQHCAVYDGRGNIVLTICKPVDFVIEKADRKAMIVVGRTNREMVKSAEERTGYRQPHTKSHLSKHAQSKNKRYKRFEEKKHHGQSGHKGHREHSGHRDYDGYEK
jgi:hypothetical protein